MVNSTYDYRNVDEILILSEQINENEKASQYPILAVLWAKCHFQTLFLEVWMVYFFDDNLTIYIKIGSTSLLVQ